MARLLDILPVLLLLLLAALLALIAYHIYTYTHTVVKTSSQKLAQKNINFTKDKGMTVGVKDVSNEQYEQKLQRGLVKTWNAHCTPPAGKEPEWDGQEEAWVRGRGKGSPRTFLTRKISGKDA